MITIHFPEPDFKIQQKDGQPYIFDNIRKKWLLLQDEEWVRQNFINYLLKVKNYPKTIIAIEKEIQLGELRKRFDILVFDKEHKPWMLIECKAQGVKLNTGTFDQILRYNISLPSKYLIITNGSQTFGWQNTGKQLKEINTLPDYTNS
ncbi:MAG: type I restriction enzyme HsdR N-terminal domain-containing protein [Sphingobacteriales bacterium]|nr:type I restriction enzyme HsdR N-terminal domain-containing protein [Sphingobacteriales bacterium]